MTTQTEMTENLFRNWKNIDERVKYLRKRKMAHYTDEKLLTIADLKRLRDQYNNAGEHTDRNFMNELFHGLDGIIDNLEQSMLDCQRLRRELDDCNGVIR